MKEGKEGKKGKKGKGRKGREGKGREGDTHVGTARGATKTGVTARVDDYDLFLFCCGGGCSY